MYGVIHHKNKKGLQVERFIRPSHDLNHLLLPSISSWPPALQKAYSKTRKDKIQTARITKSSHAYPPSHIVHYIRKQALPCIVCDVLSETTKSLCRHEWGIDSGGKRRMHNIFKTKTQNTITSIATRWPPLRPS